MSKIFFFNTDIRLFPEDMILRFCSPELYKVMLFVSFYQIIHLVLSENNINHNWTIFINLSHMLIVVRPWENRNHSFWHLPSIKSIVPLYLIMHRNQISLQNIRRENSNRSQSPWYSKEPFFHFLQTFFSLTMEVVLSETEKNRKSVMAVAF